MMMMMIISMWKWGNDPHQLWWCPYFYCCCWWSSMPLWWSPSTVRHDDVDDGSHHHCCCGEATTKLPKLTIRKEFWWSQSFDSSLVSLFVVVSVRQYGTGVRGKRGNECCWLLSLLVFIPYSIRLIDANKNEECVCRRIIHIYQYTLLLHTHIYTCIDRCG